jgi:hypothetical protein
LPEGDKRAEKKLSVIVGAVDAKRSIARCLSAIRETCAGLDAEVVVVSAGDDQVVSDSAAGLELLVMPRDTLTPMLWAAGIKSSTGEVVALTTAHCFVTAGWARSLLSALTSGAAAVGGPLRLAADSSNVDAAIFFLRYSAYIDGRHDGTTQDIAGDNCAYWRNKIPNDAWSPATGFWEVDVNKALHASGNSIVWSAAAVTEFGKSFTMRSIAHHRFEHGRLFGRSRVSGGESRARIAFGAPLVPFILLARIAQRLRGRPEYQKRFITCIPYILILATCWASGEAAGAIDGSRADWR